MATDVRRSLDALALGLGGFDCYTSTAAAEYTPPTNTVWFAMTMLSDVNLAAEGTDSAIGTVSPTPTYVTIPSGTTIYGQFTKIKIQTAAQKIICYRASYGG